MLLDTILPNNRTGKVIEIQCDTCGAKKAVNQGNYNKSLRTRTANPSLAQGDYCRPCSVKETAKRSRGKVAWNKGRKSPETSGANSSSWTGGRHIDYHGYVMIHVGEPEGGSKSKWEHYRKEHIVVMEKHIGRTLIKGEAVHHIDGNKQNNILSNLYLATNATHRDAHQSLQEIGYMLIRKGVITFNSETGKYVAHVKWGELLEQLEVANQHPSLGSDTFEGSETRNRI